MGDRRNRLIELVLGDNKLIEYLDNSDWVNFWIALYDKLYDYDIGGCGIISESELNEFKKLIPHAFNLIKFAEGGEPVCTVCIGDTEVLEVEYLTTDDINWSWELKPKNSEILHFFNEDACLKFAKANNAHMIVFEADSGVYLNISPKDEIYIEIFNFRTW